MRGEKNMTKEDKIKAFAMRLDGKTLQDIADTFCVSRQYISQILNVHDRNKKRPFACIYPNLKRWMEDHNYTVRRFETEIAPEKNQGLWNYKLRGKVSITIREAQKILALTGLTFEECFAEEIAVGGGSDG